MEIEIEVLEIKKVENDQKLKGIATIELKYKDKSFLKISGMKILKGGKPHEYYTMCPNSSHTERGLKRWESILNFQRDLWKVVQKEILKKYLEEERRDGDKKFQNLGFRGEKSDRTSL